MVDYDSAKGSLGRLEFKAKLFHCCKNGLSSSFRREDKEFMFLEWGKVADTGIFLT